MIRTILSAGGVLVAFGIFFMYTQPTYDKLGAIKREIAQYDQALLRAAELQELKQSLLSRYNSFNPDDIARLQKLLPDHVDNVRLVLDLDSVAGKHGMALQNVVISAPTEGQGAALADIGGVRQKYESLTLKFSTRASYPIFVSFMENLEASLRVVDLVSLTLGADDSGEKSTEPLYRFDITLRTYWLK